MPRQRSTVTKTKPRRGKQLELTYRTWGGRRPGAGRKPKRKGAAPHGRRPAHNPSHPVHVSLKKANDEDIPSLRQPDVAEAIVDCLREIREKYQTKSPARAIKPDFRIVHFSIQDSHLHLVLEAEGRKALSSGMQGLAIRVAKRINKVLGRKGQVFADRYFEVRMTSPRQTRNGLAYVVLNYRRHTAQAGLRCEPGWIDPFSSGHYFDGWRGLKPRPPPDERPPVSAPTVWLLTVGWRRHGLLHPDEVPGRKSN